MRKIERVRSSAETATGSPGRITPSWLSTWFTTLNTCVGLAFFKSTIRYSKRASMPSASSCLISDSKATKSAGLALTMTLRVRVSGTKIARGTGGNPPWPCCCGGPCCLCCCCCCCCWERSFLAESLAPNWESAPAEMGAVLNN